MRSERSSHFFYFRISTVKFAGTPAGMREPRDRLEHHDEQREGSWPLSRQFRIPASSDGPSRKYAADELQSVGDSEETSVSSWPKSVQQETRKGDRLLDQTRILGEQSSGCGKISDQQERPVETDDWRVPWKPSKPLQHGCA